MIFALVNTFDDSHVDAAFSIKHFYVYSEMKWNGAFISNASNEYIFFLFEVSWEIISITLS
jgi:hypothetical protein